MNIDRNILFTLQHCESIGWKSISLLMKSVPSPNEINKLTPADLRNILPISASKINAFYKQFHSFDPLPKMKEYEDRNIRFITVFDHKYPPLLKNIYDPPWVLFFSGKSSLLERDKKIAIVGSRKADEYSSASLNFLLPQLVKENFVIVSGLAAGADEMAHRKTIELKGDTIAVIGGGLDHIYPAANRRLAEWMKTNQLILSEYPPDTMPQRWHFPLRNRIISGMTQAVLVTQASRKSGSLITAEYSLNEGRDVFALPGRMDSSLSEGSNLLIQQGAKLITSSEDIVSEFAYNSYKNI
ncbi:DNA-protecting protein DprA [Rossellomorea vietnamensis]|uniref:DNA-protecting protein DprA n=1 Tax=Rossellomorea vietnamensis TaxID=218284 RepID=A0A5D4NS54_9BACI|nr:DNA-processing protein DprA [Rossellomorea vietnamensis]TYS16298.1 DNA-protecting protein DprA [Rossellomorea vietnamensis]